MRSRIHIQIMVAIYAAAMATKTAPRGLCPASVTLSKNPPTPMNTMAWTK